MIARQARGEARETARSMPTGRGATPTPFAARPARTPGARPGGRRGGDRRRDGTRPRGRGGLPSVSDPDRVPDRLHLEEGGDPLWTFGCAVVEPVETGLVDARRAARETLDVIGRELLRLEAHRIGHAP